jgi:predicted dienelactone hydrolase
MYDPFATGTHPVRTTTGELIDGARGRRLPYQVWSPSTHDRAPLIAYSHTSGGHKGQASFLCSHLASHGYVVAAVDHVGTTAADAAERAERAARGERMTRAESDAFVRRIIADRVPDIRFLLDAMLGGATADSIDRDRIGLVGHSFGGWAVLAVPEVDDRVRAIVAMAPAGNSKPLPGIIPATLTFAWRREVATLFLVAECDRFTPLAGQYELLERAPARKRMFILRDADHGHFADEITDRGCAPEDAHTFVRGLALAHFDAVLKERRDAEAFFGGALEALEAGGVAALGPP